MMKLVDWNEQFKIRTTDCRIERDKHEVCKLLLLRKLIRKHKGEKQYIRIYTEFEVYTGLICDVYFENSKTKEKYAFEIQKEDKDLKEKIKKYEEWKDIFYTTDLIVIDLKRLSTEINEMEKQLEEFII